jgi:hypothetical protein
VKFRAPYASPPIALAAAHTDSSAPAHAGAPCSDANAGRLISTAPKQNPIGTVASMIVRTPDERSAPSIPCEPAAGSGRHVRDGLRVTNNAVPDSVHSAHRISAAIGETIATIAAANSGPAVNSSSIATESSANAAGRSSRRRASNAGQSVRSAAPRLGIANPPTNAHAISAPVGAPDSVSAIRTPVAAASTNASGSSTRPCPSRSISRLCSGDPIAAPIPNAPSTTPATANDPRSSAMYSTSASANIPYGSRASIDAPSSGATWGARRMAA